MATNNIQKTNAGEILKLDLHCIYPVTDILKAAGAGRKSIEKLKREGLEVRWFGGRQWAKAADVWEVMRQSKKQSSEQS